MTRFKEWAKLKQMFKIPNHSECMQVKTKLKWKRYLYFFICSKIKHNIGH